MNSTPRSAADIQKDQVKLTDKAFWFMLEMLGYIVIPALIVLFVSRGLDLSFGIQAILSIGALGLSASLIVLRAKPMISQAKSLEKERKASQADTNAQTV